MRTQANYATIKPAPDGSLEFYSSYDPALVADLKRVVPYNDRRWNGDKKCWLIAPQHQARLEDLCRDHLGIAPAVQRSIVPPARGKQIKFLKVEYIGAPKERDDGNITAFGFCDGGWNVIFPQDALRQWFEPGGDTPHPAGATTFYGLLGLARDCDESVIKRAYRNMVKRWHPDVSKEPDAAEMMKRINQAYEVLKDPITRRKYDAGLAFEASIKKEHRRQADDFFTAQSWRPPIRCGWILAEGQSSLGRFAVEKIVQWEDVTDSLGRVMVTSWPAGSDHFVVSWV